MAIHLIFRIWVAAQACHSLAEARNSGTLDLMFSTPLTTSEIIQGQVLALKRLFTGPVVAILALEGVFLFGVGWGRGRYSRHCGEYASYPAKHVHIAGLYCLVRNSGYSCI